MIQAGTLVQIADNTGIILAQCIKVFGPFKKRIALIGDVVLLSVKRINLRKFSNIKKSKRRRKFFKGTLVRGLVVRSKVNFCRISGIFIKFNENAVVVVNKKIVPVSNRVFGPILRELSVKRPFLGCITHFLI